MNKKPLILAAAMSGLATTANGHVAPETVTLEVEKCYGIQKKGENGCGIENNDIAAANAAFKNKYKKSTTFECAGNVLGSGKNGYLAWVYVARGSCHKIEGGFLIIQDKNGKKIVDKG